MPGARQSDELWHLLRNNRCSVSWITPDRFPTQAYYHPSPDQLGRSYTFAAGVIDDVWGFDAAAFGMSPREAEQVDPQHRHLLEVTHDALAHAGVKTSSLAGSETGVYIGASSVDHAARLFADPMAADVHMATGNSLSIMANRLSYTLDLHGPSFALDTACSSSLVALHLAAEAIRNGTIDTAIVGGVNLLLSPFSYVGFSRASMLSPTGLCRPFDAAADGYVRSEGAIVVVLRSMAAAHKARNRIHAVLVGSGMNQDGRTTGVFVPSATSQRQLLDQVYGDFSVDPADLLFVEAHGTGTRVGDPIEADALGKGLGQKRSQPLPIGSVKSNVGHLEPVSGLAGMLKSILALNHGMVPATLHQKSPSPDIPFDELNLRVVDRNWRLAANLIPARTALDGLDRVAGYALAPTGPAWLLLVNVGLILNWLGDSLDGKVARLQGIERPRYGFFLDQSIDVVSQLLFALGLGLSGYVRLDIAVLGLATFWMMSVQGLLRAQVTRVFQLATAGMGLTEVRCLFLVANVVFYVVPPRPLDIAGGKATYADFFGIVWIVVNVGLYVLTMVAELKKLAVEEPPAGPPPGDRPPK